VIGAESTVAPVSGSGNLIEDSTGTGGGVDDGSSDLVIWIVVGVVACLLCLVLIIVIVFLQRRRQKRRAVIAQAAADVYSPIGAPISPRTAVAVYGNTPAAASDDAYLAMPMRTLTTQLPPPPPPSQPQVGGVYVAPDLSGGGGSLAQDYNNLRLTESVDYPRGSTADLGRTTFIDPGYGLIPSAPRPLSTAISDHTADTASTGNTYSNLMPLHTDPHVGQYRASQAPPNVGNYVATDGGGYDPAMDPQRRSLPFPPPPPPIV
jgi:hypothetical protein